MPDSPAPADFRAEIAVRLAAVRAPDSPDEFTADELRDLALEYLAEYDDDVREEPDLKGEPHWNVWLSDSDPARALFVALIFRPRGLEFFCGSGEAGAITAFAEDEFPDEVDDVPAEMAKRFAVPGGSLHVVKRDGLAWLGRGW